MCDGEMYAMKHDGIARKRVRVGALLLPSVYVRMVRPRMARWAPPMARSWCPCLGMKRFARRNSR